MPLPNAKPDKRIYELLKNVDLENLTFSDLQSVGQTIFAEQGAEDELRRLVLVNLARLSLQEWTGLTSSGGGGTTAQAQPLIAGSDVGSNQALHNFGCAVGFLNGNTSTQLWTDTTTTAAKFVPAIAPKTGTLDEFVFRVGATAGDTIHLAIYAADDDTLMPTGDPLWSYNTGTTTANTQYEPSISISVERGKFYWIGFFGQSSRSTLFSAWPGYGSVQIAGTVPRFFTALNYSNNHSALELTGLTNGVWPTITAATDFVSQTQQYFFRHTVHIT